jgi:hypothetical protein
MSRLPFIILVFVMYYPRRGCQPEVDFRRHKVVLVGDDEPVSLLSSPYPQRG